MPDATRLNGIYAISDNRLTPLDTIYTQAEEILKNGIRIFQLRDKENDRDIIKEQSIKLQELCKKYDALFVLNDEIELAIELGVDGLHIGKSDYDRFDEIRSRFAGVIGVSCYGDVAKALDFQHRGADYVAFGSFFTSPTKPDSSVVPKSVISEAKEKLDIPVCVIGGINESNIDEILEYEPDMIAMISGIWQK